MGLLLLVTGLPGLAGADPFFLSVSPRDDVLRTIDAADGSTVDASVTLTLPGSTVLLKVVGLAQSNYDLSAVNPLTRGSQAPNFPTDDG